MSTADHSSLPLRLEALSEMLEQVDSIADLGNAEEPEPRTLAYALVEIAESCRRIADQVDLLVEEEPTNALAVLEEVREDLRHILYHVQDSGFLQVINPPGEAAD